MASFGLIHHFEVLVRNAIDGVLGDGQPEAPIEETWLVDFGTLRPDGIGQVVKVIDRLERRRDVTRSRVIAGLTFAFWVDLFGRHYEGLWRQRLHAAFPYGRLTRKEVGAQMKRVRRFRNRIAHHDSSLNKYVAARIDVILEIAAWIDPHAREWLETLTGASEIARQVARYRDPLGDPG